MRRRPSTPTPSYPYGAPDIVYPDIISQNDAFLQNLAAATHPQLPRKLPDSRHRVPPLRKAESGSLICSQRAGDLGGTESLWWMSLLQEAVEVVLEGGRSIHCSMRRRDRNSCSAAWLIKRRPLHRCFTPNTAVAWSRFQKSCSKRASVRPLWVRGGRVVSTLVPA